MIHHCKSCPSISKSEKHLKKHFQLTYEPESVSSDKDGNRTHDFEEEEATITFKQRVSTDQANLVSHAITISDYIATLCEKLDAHSYTAKLQARYLANLKDNIQEGEVVL